MNLSKMKNGLISALCAAALMCSSMPVFAVNNSYADIGTDVQMELFAQEGVRQYLTADYCVSQTGVAKDQTNNSLDNCPQIYVKANTSAKIVVRPENLSAYKSVSVSYAQKGGEMIIKLLSSATVEEEGEEVAKVDIAGANDYVTRNSDKVNLDTSKIGSNEYIIVEITPTTDAWVDFVEFFETEYTEPTPIPEEELPVIEDADVAVLKSLGNGNVIEIDKTGSVASAWESRETNQQWTLEQDTKAEEGWYYIVNKSTGKGLGMSGGTTAEGATPIQWDKTGATDQFWRFVKVEKNGEIYYKIINKNSKLVLTAGNKTVTQEKYDENNDNQLWKAVTAEGVDFAYGEKYDQNYKISSVSLKAASNVISYTVMHTQAEGMCLEVTLSKDNTTVGTPSDGATGMFNISGDGNYTVTAKLYEDDTKTVEMCEPVSKTITVTDGGYTVLGADWICSTETNPWTDQGTVEMTDVTDAEIAEIEEGDKDYIIVDPNTRYQEMDANPWGGCFNEMGWEYLMQLNPNYTPQMTTNTPNDVRSLEYTPNSEKGTAQIDYDNLTEEQREVIDLLFKPDYGLGFTSARMSIGASDFGLDMYTFNDIDRYGTDYDMKNFDASRELEHMIPYIKAANKAAGMAEGETIPIFGSPWTPPAWMKTNHNLNGKKAGTPYINATIVDGKADENTDKLFKAYAKYFVEYLKYYHAQGIDIAAITPQNEVTMNTPYPSCIWSGEQLNVFLRDYLWPAVDEYNKAHATGADAIDRNVEVWHGTFTDANQEKVWPIFKDPVTSKKVQAYCFQWWGASLADKVYMSSKSEYHPEVDENGEVKQGAVNPVKLIQSETKCGGSENNWTYAEEQFDCFKQFLDVGTSQYHLWNMILDKGGSNNAKPNDMRWPQNAPITIDLENHTYTVNPQFYQVKHFSTQIKPYARKVKTTGSNLGEGEVSKHEQDVRAISFQNTDGEVVVNLKNSTAENKELTVVVGAKKLNVTVPSHSINTFKVNKDFNEFKNTPDATEVVEREAATEIKLTSAATGYVLTADGTSGIKTEVEKGEGRQQWRLVDKDADDYYHLVNFYSELGIAVWNGSKAAGADIKQYANTGAADQKWRFEFVGYRGEGAERKPYYKIVNRNSGLVLSIRTDSDPVPDNVEKTELTQTEYTGAENQLWAITDLTDTWPFPEDTEKPDDTAKTATTVKIDGNKYTLATRLYNVPAGSTVIVGAYKNDGALISAKTLAAADTVTTVFDNLTDVDYFKVMVWDTLHGMKPVTAAEKVKAEVTPSTPEPTTKPNKNTAHMLYGADFNEQTTEAYKGKTTQNGAVTFEKVADGDYAAVFNGTDSFLSLTNADGTPLLRDWNNVIVTMKAKSTTHTSNGWYFFTSWTDAGQNNNKRSYLGVMEAKDGGNKGVEAQRYRDVGAGNELYGPSKRDDWQEITYVISPKKSELYVDGQFCGDAEYPVDLKTTLGNGDGQITYIGKGCWGNGEYFKGAIDDIEIYDFAPEIILGVRNDQGFDVVSEDIDLPTATEAQNGYSITWKTSDESVVTADGKITRPASGVAEATLTATITFNGHTLTRESKVLVLGQDYNEIELNIKNEKNVDIQPNMYGLFFEDINYGADGGLYAEMVENRSFEQKKTVASHGTGEFAPKPNHAWISDNGTMTFMTAAAAEEDISEGTDGDTAAVTDALDADNPTYLRFTGKSFKNKAYEGMNIEQGKTYNISFYAKSSDGADVNYGSLITAKAVNKEETTGFTTTFTYANADDKKNKFEVNGWRKYSASVAATENARYSDLLIELNDSITTAVDFDMISVMPGDAVVNGPGGTGVLRADLVQMLKDLKPGFLRFPGGCVVEGYSKDDRYRWKDTVGAIEERKQNWNRWAADQSNEEFLTYNQTYGLGFYEYFMLCEELGCDPLPVLNGGMFCQYQSKEIVPLYNADGSVTDEFMTYVQDALDLIEFATGDANDPTKEWAQLRKEMGHPEPFNLTMVGIGNEQWEENGRYSGDVNDTDMVANQWQKRYEIFEEAIHAAYPNIKLISTSGPDPDDSHRRGFGAAWNWLRSKYTEIKAENPNREFAYAVDEHYYCQPGWFYDCDWRYDNYDRNGPKVFAGEYASKDTTYNNALSEAAYMTGLERNADVVYMASYAPLFGREGFTQWNPDLIYFNDKECYGAASYYVQKMYSTNNGDYTLKTEAVKGVTEKKIYQTVCYDEESGDIIVKLVNSTDHVQKAKLTFDGFTLTGAATVQNLERKDKNDLGLRNSITAQDNISIKTTENVNVTNGMVYEVQPYSFIVMRVHTN